MSLPRRLCCVSAVLWALSGCGGGTDGEIADTQSPLPAPSVAVSGVATKGAISAATVTITDAAGGEIEILAGTVTQNGGTYRAVFSEAAVAQGISTPLTVNITGGSSRCDIDLPDTTDDCQIDDETFIAFGSDFALPEEFRMRATISRLETGSSAPDATYTINVSPASELATSLAEATAASSALTQEDIETAERRIKGLIGEITGISLGSQQLAQIELFDITALDANTDNASDASYALLAFAAATLAELEPDNTSVDTLAEVFARLHAELNVGDSGDLEISGTSLSRLAGSVETGLGTVIRSLAARGITRPGLTSAESLARDRITEWGNQGDDLIQIPASDLSQAAAIELTRQFARSLTRAMTETQSSPTKLSNGTTRLVLEQTDAATTGTFVVGVGENAIGTATLDKNGVITYADGSFETLPAPL